MREVFQGEMQQLGGELGGMCRLAAEAMRQATQALLNGDLRLAEQVIEANTELTRARRTCEEHAMRLLVLQSPVATDLRTILATLYCAVKVERMGDLAAHVADIIRNHHPVLVVPAELEVEFRSMGERDVSMAEHLIDLVTGSRAAAGGFNELHTVDNAVDTLHAELLTALTRSDWPYGTVTAVNLALLGRFYERFADQAVSVARRLEFAATGTLPEGRH